MSRLPAPVVAGLLSLATAVTAVFASPAVAQDLSEDGRFQPAPSTRINLDVVREDLAEVMDQVQRRVNVRIRVHPDIYNEEVTIALRDIPWREAVDVIAQMTRCEVREVAPNFLLLDPAPRVTLQFNDTHVRTVLQLLLAYSGRDAVIDEEVSGWISLDLKEVHWAQALGAIAEITGCKAWEDSAGLVLVTSSWVPPADSGLLPFQGAAPPLPGFDTQGLEGQLGAPNRINLDVVREDLREVADQIGRRVNANVVVEPGVFEEVTLAVWDVPWPLALRVIAWLTRCEIEVLPGGIVVLSQPPKVTLQFTNADVRVVLGDLAAHSGKNLVVDPSVQGRVTLDLKHVHWRRALDMIAVASDIRIVESGVADVLWAVPTEVAETTQSTEEAPAPAGPQTGGAPVNLDAVDLDLSLLVDRLATEVAQDVRVDPRVQEQLSISLRDVGWRNAVDVIAHLTRCDVRELEGGALLLTQPPRVAIQLRKADLRTVLELLAERAGRDLVLAPEVQGEVTVDLRRLEWEDALWAIAVTHGCRVRDTEGALHIEFERAAHPDAVVPNTPGAPSVTSEEERRLTVAIADAQEGLDCLEALLQLPGGPLAQVASAPDDEAPAGSQEELEAQAERLLDELGERAAQPDDDWRLTLRRLESLRQILASLAAQGSASSEGLRRRLTGLRELVVSAFRGRLLYAGPKLLRAMAESISDEEYERVLELRAEVERLVAHSSAEELRDDIQALSSRADELATRARRLQRIGAFTLVISGVVEDLETGRNQAVINGRVHETGDSVIAPHAGQVIEGLLVEEIQGSAVRFRFEGSSFVRELQAPSYGYDD
jgi:hypothetical protein